MTTYHYRPHLKWGQKFTIWLLTGLGGCVFVLFTAMGYGWLGLILALLLLGEAWLIRYFFNRFIRVKVTTTDDGIQYQNAKANLQLGYDQIQVLRFPSAKYLGGWIRISTASDSIRLTVVLEGIGEFLRELKHGLDRHQTAADYDAKKLFSFFKTAVYSDQSWARLYDVFGRLIGAHFGAFFVGALLTFVLRPDLPIFSKMLIGLLSSFWVMSVYFYGEQRFIKVIEQQTDPNTWEYPPRDLAQEAAVYRQGIKWGAITYLLIIPAVIWFVL